MDQFLHKYEYTCCTGAYWNLWIFETQLKNNWNSVFAQSYQHFHTILALLSKYSIRFSFDYHFGIKFLISCVIIENELTFFERAKTSSVLVELNLNIDQNYFSSFTLFLALLVAVFVVVTINIQHFKNNNLHLSIRFESYTISFLIKPLLRIVYQLK